jgi:hypothetical protein
MAYWRMQLHPSSSGDAVKHTVKSLAAGYIGLDFAIDVGDLLRTEQSALPATQKDYWAFAHSMDIDDLVLIQSHHFPFALARISGGYNYIRSPAPEIGVWFRHFRPVDRIRYYADFRTNAREWDRITMTDTISPLHDSAGKAHCLIEEWNRASAL